MTVLSVIGSIFHLQKMYLQSYKAHCNVKVVRFAATDYSEQWSLHQWSQEYHVQLNIDSALQSNQMITKTGWEKDGLNERRAIMGEHTLRMCTFKHKVNKKIIFFFFFFLKKLTRSCHKVIEWSLILMFLMGWTLLILKDFCISSGTTTTSISTWYYI